MYNNWMAIIQQLYEYQNNIINPYEINQWISMDYISLLQT